MNRERLAPVVLALLAVLALAGAAATLDSARSGSLAGDGDGTGLGDSDARSIDLGAPPSPEDPVPAAGVPELLGLLFAAAVVIGVLAAVVRVYREGLPALKRLVALVVPIAIVLVLLYFLLLGGVGAPTGEQGIGASEKPLLPGGGSSGADGSTGEAVATSPPLAAVALLAVVLLGALVVVVRATGDGEADPLADGDPGPDDPTPRAAAVGEAAGRAADRIEGESTFENAVYRAWREMTDPLDLPRETSTPGEFAAAAVDAGMRPEEVEELTGLFEATRYGGVAPDGDRERRAVDALRRIEREYGEGR